MPSDLIFREDAKDYARHAMAKGMNVIEYLDEVPAADVRPVVRGRWVDEPIKGIRYHCSVCQGRFDYTWYFCPNCGADMRPTQMSGANGEES